MITATQSRPAERRRRLQPGDEVIVRGAPEWCRRYLAGLTGRVTRVLPFPNGEVWVRFDAPVSPWCERMEPLAEFPFTREELILSSE